MTSQYAVPGCQSQSYFWSARLGQHISLKGQSTSRVTSGILGMMVYMYDLTDIVVVPSIDYEFVITLDVFRRLTWQRQQLAQFVLNQLRRHR